MILQVFTKAHNRPFKFTVWMIFRSMYGIFTYTPEDNKEPENGELEDVFPFPRVYSQVPC